MKALLLGASGLTGSYCLQYLLAEAAYTQVIVAVRKALPLQHAKLRQVVVDFDAPEAQAEALQADAVFCCLGTTIKKAGSQAAFRKVDYEYPLKFAQLARQQGARTFVLVSALGASAQSSVFYSRVKGEVEEAIGRLGFAHYIVVRPSLLLGPRKESRLGEDIAKLLNPLMNLLLQGPLKKYRGIAASDVALAMIRLSLMPPQPRRVAESGELQALASGE